MATCRRCPDQVEDGLHFCRKHYQREMKRYRRQLAAYERDMARWHASSRDERHTRQRLADRRQITLFASVGALFLALATWRIFLQDTMHPVRNGFIGYLLMWTVIMVIAPVRVFIGRHMRSASYALIVILPLCALIACISLLSDSVHAHAGILYSLTIALSLFFTYRAERNGAFRARATPVKPEPPDP